MKRRKKWGKIPTYHSQRGRTVKKTKLLTEFVRVATSGRTVDGRTIKAEDLKAMAKHYNPELYTAQIWLEHNRSYPPLGQVVELDAVEKNGKTELFAKLAPSYEMIAMNKKGQGLFTSIEITPNFADIGEAYLTGLAVTDSPASTGTTHLAFNQQEHEVIVSDNLRLNFHLYNEQKAMSKEQVKKNFFSWLFSKDEPETEETAEQQAQTPEGTQDFSEKESMNKEDILAIAQATAAAVKQVFASQTTPAQPVEEPEKTEETVTITKSEYNALKASAEKAGDLESRVAEIEKQFSALRTQAVTTVPVGATNSFAINTAI